eukprot:941965-Prymnesium_polylepis.1
MKPNRKQSANRLQPWPSATALSSESPGLDGGGAWTAAVARALVGVRSTTVSVLLKWPLCGSPPPRRARCTERSRLRSHSDGPVGGVCARCATVPCVAVTGTESSALRSSGGAPHAASCIACSSPGHTKTAAQKRLIHRAIARGAHARVACATTGHAGKHGAPSGQTGTYPLVGG